MDGPAVLASPSSARLRRENTTDLEDLVLELDEAALNGVDSSPESNDYKDMKLSESPPSMEKSSGKRDEPCENSTTDSFLPASALLSLKSIDADPVGKNSLETEIKEEEHLNDVIVESNAGLSLEAVEVKEEEEEEDVKPTLGLEDNPISIDQTDVVQDNIDSIDKELDGLLNTNSENMEVKEEDTDSIHFGEETMENNAFKIDKDVLFEDTDDKSKIAVTVGEPISNGIISNSDLENSEDEKNLSEIISNNAEEMCKEVVVDVSQPQTSSAEGMDVDKESSREPSEPLVHSDTSQSGHDIVDKSKKMQSNKRQTERNFEEITKKLKIDTGEKIVNGIKKPINGLREGTFAENVYSNKKRKEVKKEVLNDISMKNKVSFGVQTEEDYKVAREQLAAVKFLNRRPLTVDGNMLEELVMMKVVEYLTLGEQNEKRLDCAALMKKCRLLENSLQQVQKKSQELTKQVEDAKHIIKKLIEDRVACKKPLLPLRVTRSVGLQVCTVGSVNVVSTKQKDLESLKKLTGEAATSGSQEEKDDIIYVGETPGAQKEDESNNKKTGDKPNVSSTKSPVSQVQNTAKSRTQNTSTPGTPTTKAPVPIKTSPNTPDSSTTRKDTTSSKTVDTPCIDLTDTDDPPPPTKDQAKAGGISVKPPEVLYSSDKFNGTSKTQPTENSGAVSKLPRKSTGDTSKKVTFAPTVAEPANSVDHLPKLPATPKYPSDAEVPPRPILRIGKNTSGKSGIMLSWCFENQITPPNIEEYHLFAYQENKGNPGEEKGECCWKKVGDIGALPLPMACFLTQFIEGHTYHFIVRAVNKDKRVGEFSLPGSISLQEPQSSSSLTSSSKTN